MTAILNNSSTPPALIFSALGDDTRLELIQRLLDGTPKSVSYLTQGFNISRQAIRKHLNHLEKAGIIRPTKVGREQLFQIQIETIESSSKYLAEISSQWDVHLNNLTEILEDETVDR